MGDLYYINRSLTNINITTGLQYSNTNQHQLTEANQTQFDPIRLKRGLVESKQKTSLDPYHSQRPRDETKPMESQYKCWWPRFGVGQKDEWWPTCFVESPSNTRSPPVGKSFGYIVKRLTHYLDDDATLPWCINFFPNLCWQRDGMLLRFVLCHR